MKLVDLYADEVYERERAEEISDEILQQFT